MLKILISSDLSYEKLVAEIYYKDKFVALINQERGINDLEIEFPSSNFSEDFVERKIPLNFLKAAIEEATEALIGEK